jgi:hypothetical protein
LTDSTISNLTAATTPLAGTETLPIVQSGVTVKATVANITGAGLYPGSFTTLASTGNTTLGDATTDTVITSGNVGVGVTPATWGGGYKALQIASRSSFAAGGSANPIVVYNGYFDGTNWIYQATTFASRYEQTVGEHRWATAPSGTAAGTITFTQYMVLTVNGNLGLNTTPSASAILDAQSTTKGVRMPNMTTTQKNAISSPAAGLIIFDTTLAKLCVYSGAAWQTITSL